MKNLIFFILFVIILIPIIIYFNKEIQTFKDIKDHWAYKSIVELSDKKIIGGYPDNTFKPNKKITRQEAVKLISNIFNFPLEKKYNLTFNDNNEINSWAKQYIHAAIKANILTGYEDNTFRPNNPITREEFCVLFIKAMGFKVLQSDKTNFDDDNEISNWSKGYVNHAVKLGLLHGFIGDVFKPKNNITRAEVCSIGYEYLKKCNN